MVLVRPAVFKNRSPRLQIVEEVRFPLPLPMSTKSYHRNPIGTQKMNKNVIIGVAGHVDHGKTSFVLLPDRYRHRQASGRKAARLVIGLRHCLLEKPDGSAAAFVDVPGHSNFLKTPSAVSTVLMRLYLSSPQMTE